MSNLFTVYGISLGVDDESRVDFLHRLRMLAKTQLEELLEEALSWSRAKGKKSKHATQIYLYGVIVDDVLTIQP